MASNRRWRCQFRYRGLRCESAVAQLFSLGIIRAPNNMKPKDIFRIIVATGGLYCFILGAVHLFGAVVNRIAEVLSNDPGRFAAIGLVEMIFGVLLMKGYPPFADIAFPSDEQPTDKPKDDLHHDA
jgi:hypothetical protein